MPEGYSYEIRETAKDLYVTEGLTYDQVSDATGVSVSQLKRWGSDEDWTGARKEFREALSSIKRDTVRLRAKLLKTALDSGGDPQSVYAFTALEKVFAPGKGKAGEPEERPVNPDKLKNINTPADAVEALQEVVEIKLNRMLSQPDTLQLSQIKELKQTMELIEQMRVKYTPKEDVADTGLDAESIKNIREMLQL